MILYCSAIPALIYPLLVHKLGMNHDKKAVLFYDENIFETRGLSKTVRAFKEQGLFDDVVGCDMFIDRNLSELQMRAVLTEHFDKILLDNGYDINEFDEICVLNDTWDGDINLYLNYKEIRYTWIEVVQNYLCELPHPSINDNFASIIKKYKTLTPFAKFADACLLEQSDQSKEKLKSKGYTTWNIQKLYDKITPDDMDLIGKCFSIDSLSNTEQSTLIIRNSYGYAFSQGFGTASKYVKILNGFGNYGNEVILSALEKTAIDLYAPNTQAIYLKEHPNDSLSGEKMQEIYRGYVTSFTDMPFEFVIKYFSTKHIKFDTIIGYSSNSLKTIDPSIYNKLYILGNSYLKSWYYYSSIYTSLIYAVNLDIKKIYADSTIKEQLEFLMEVLDISLEIYILDINKINQLQNSMIIINCLEAKNTDNYSDIFARASKTSIVCFFNAELSEQFFDDNMSEYFAPIHIQKKKLIDDILDLFYDENIWVFSKDQQLLNKTRDFKMRKSMPKLGVELSVEPSSLSDSMSMYKSAELIDYRYKLNDLKAQYNLLEKRIDSIVGIMADGDITPSERIKSSKTFAQYIDLLKIYQDRFLILIAVKDTPGERIPPNVMENLHKLGFTALTNELWKMYIGVSNKSKIIYNKSGAKSNDALMYTVDSRMDGVEISVSSMSWKNGNKAQIIINGVDYSINMRGLNIVVYDVEPTEVVDSVGYDAHTSVQKFLHKML